jgi:hypothetical protein
MMGESTVARAEYETNHGGKTRPCRGAIVINGETFMLRERIQVGIDQQHGRELFDERSRVVSLPEAKRILQEWTDLDIAEVTQIPWD